MENRSHKMAKFGPRSSLFLRSAFFILHSAFFLSLAGCELIGAPAQILFGEPPIAAQYVPKKVPTLVLVENYRSPDELILDGDQIAHQVGDELKTEGKMDLVDPDKLVPLREEDPAKFRAMSCQAIGRQVGARQIIYVDLVESAVTGDMTQTVVHAHAMARVQVVDVATGKPLWPSDASHGTELEAKMDYDPTDSSKAMSMRTNMLTQLSSRIAKLFYKWKPDDQDQENAGE